MPQMAPIMWLSLFILVSLSIFVISSFLFFNYNPHSFDSTKITMPMTKKTWTW